MNNLDISKRLLLTICLSVFGVALSTDANALPPDPGNTCGGNGACQSEAFEAQQWQDTCDAALQDSTWAFQDWQLCYNACTGAGMGGCYAECQPEADAYHQASAIADTMCSQAETAQSSLEACIQGCGW